MKLLIATPTYNGVVTGLFTQSLVGLFRTLGWAAEWRTTKAVLIVHARNQFASLCLEGDYTHLLFLDADVDFHPRVVERMLAFDQPLVAAAYPHRALSIPAFHAAARHYERPQVALAAALTFPVELEAPRVTRGEFHRASLAPTGLMLIQRRVFEEMREAHPELYCATAPNPEDFDGLSHVLQCFDPLADARGLKMGEDVSFCRRWTDLGGEIWVTFDESIGHTGPYTFRAAPGA